MLEQKQAGYQEVRGADAMLAGTEGGSHRLAEWEGRQAELEADFVKCGTLEQELLQAQKHYQEAEKKRNSIRRSTIVWKSSTWGRRQAFWRKP